MATISISTMEMMDTNTVVLTAYEKAIKEEMAKNPTLKESLRRLWPGMPLFEAEEWKDVTRDMIPDYATAPKRIHLMNPGYSEYPFEIIKSDLPSARRYKIENGKIWRKT